MVFVYGRVNPDEPHPYRFAGNFVEIEGETSDACEDCGNPESAPQHSMVASRGKEE